MQYLYVQFNSFSRQHLTQIYIFYSIIKTRTQVNKKNWKRASLKIFGFISFFVIGRTLSYFAKFLKWTLSCWFTACFQMNRVTGWKWNSWIYHNVKECICFLSPCNGFSKNKRQWSQFSEQLDTCIRSTVWAIVDFCHIFLRFVTFLADLHVAWTLPSCSDEYITFGFQIKKKKRKQDYTLCVCVLTKIWETEMDTLGN